MSEISGESLCSLVQGFEAGTWPAANWKHEQHVMLAACYILDYPDALERLRTGIPAYNVSQGGKNTADSGYHETLTIFWYLILRKFLTGIPGMSRLESIHAAVREFAPKRDLFRDYYDFDVVKSTEARATWIPPTVGTPDILPPLPAPVKSTVPE